MKQSSMPARKQKMSRGAGPARSGPPADRDAAGSGPRPGLRPCGKGYATKDKAKQSKRGQADGATFEECQLRECGQWHVRSPESPRGALAEGRDTGPDEATRRAVYRRDGNKCVCCGTPLAGRLRSVGHRMRRSQGGGNGMPNLLTFMGLGVNQFDPDDHHARIDSRRNPADAKRGYSLRSWQDPGEVAVLVVSGPGRQTWKRLTGEGAYVDAPPGDGVAA